MYPYPAIRTLNVLLCRSCKDESLFLYWGERTEDAAATSVKAMKTESAQTPNWPKNLFRSINSLVGVLETLSVSSSMHTGIAPYALIFKNSDQVKKEKRKEKKRWTWDSAEWKSSHFRILIRWWFAQTMTRAFKMSRILLFLSSISHYCAANFIVKNSMITDTSGRYRFFHGVNAVEKGRYR